jgi:sarcosine oxidase, subunit beta
MTLPARAAAVVVGGGVMGASIAFHLAERGVDDVLLLERGHLCSGSTRHSTAIVRLHYSQPLLVRMAAHGLRTYVGFKEIVGRGAGFVRTGMLLGVDPADRAALEANVALGQSEGVGTQLVDADETALIDPRVAVDDLVFCFEPEAGYCDPYAVTVGFARAAARLGVRVVEGVAARTVADGVVETDAGRVETEAVVVAAGAWSPPLLAPLGYELPIRSLRAEVGRFRLPDSFGSPPPAVADLSAARIYFRPAGRGYLDVGSLDPSHTDRPAEPDRIPEGVERETLVRFQRGLARRLRGSERGHWRGGWSGVYDVTPDWEPAIGIVPGAERVVVAAGFSGHGFKLAPAVGLSVAELLCQGRATTFDVDLLDPRRFARGELVSAGYGYSVLG